MVYTDHAERAAVSRGTSHVTTKQCCKYPTLVLKSEFGHVWFLATLVYLLKFLYVNSCVVGRRIARNLYFILILYLVHCMC